MPAFLASRLNHRRNIRPLVLGQKIHQSGHGAADALYLSFCGDKPLPSLCSLQSGLLQSRG
ncbi:hypothetical protein P409_16735 [Inquilinus limosus MP06]|uniref:Uncharacterized protein n=1 Tax=Inquilinus limosus MP06 TaxID=1398085 RepID=A0A0A0D605_9PROT|nr:hypothetical protein P409_16735 [Inquilinus limosus MP06]